MNYKSNKDDALTNAEIIETGHKPRKGFRTWRTSDIDFSEFLVELFVTFTDEKCKMMPSKQRE
jgi:hypothetical protein